MVVLKRIEVRNFRKLNLQLDFPSEGVLIIKGPNESGKSTILEAVLYAFFGKPYRGTKDLAINHNSNTALVKLRFEVDGKEYLVERVLRRGGASEARLYHVTDRGPRLIASTVTRTNEEIAKLLGGLTMKEMLVTNVVAQKELDKIVKLGSGERDKIVNLLMGLESYNKATTRLEEIRRETRNELKSKKEILKEKEKVYLQYKRDLSELKKKRQELAEKEEKFENLSMKLKEVSDCFEALEKYHRFLEEKRNLEAEKKSTEDKISLLNRQLIDCEQLIDSYERKKKECMQKQSELKTKLSQLENRLKELKGVDIALSKLKAVESYFSRLRALLIDERRLKDEIKRLESRICELDRERKRLDIDRILNEEQALKIKLATTKINLKILIGLLSLSLIGIFSAPLLLAGILLALAYSLSVLYRRNILYRQLAEISSKIGRYKDLIVEYNNIRSFIEKRYQELKSNREEQENIKKKIKEELLSLEDKYKPSSWTNLEDLYTKIRHTTDSCVEEKRKVEQEIRVTQDKIRDLLEELKKLSTELSSLSRRAEELREQIKEENKKLQEVEQKLSRLVPPELPSGIIYSEELYEETKKELDSLREQVSSLKGQIEGIKKSIMELERRIEENKNIEKEYKKVLSEVQELEFLEEAQSRAITAIKEVARKLREAFRPTIENYMSRVISKITNGRYKAVRLNSKFDVEVFDAVAGKFIPKDIYSGGTVDQFLLAMRLAFILSLLPHTKQTYPRFLFLDEPLASSDTQRRHNILELLTSDLAKYFKQIILITHLDITSSNATIIELEEGNIIKRFST